MNYFFKALKFLNLVDRSEKLSITNLAVIVCVVKIAIAPQASIIDVGTLMLSLMNYAFKRKENNNAVKSDVQSQLDTIKEQFSKISALETTISNIKTDHEKIEKVAEETKKMLSTANIASAFGVKR